MGPFVQVVVRHAGPEAADLMNTYWSAGDLDGPTGLLTDAGLHIFTTVTREGTARFGSIDQMITTEVESTPLVQRLTPQAYQQIRADAREPLRPFETPHSQARPPLVGHIVAGRWTR